MGHFFGITHLVVKEKRNNTKSPVFVILNQGGNFKTGVLAEITLLVLKENTSGFPQFSAPCLRQPGSQGALLFSMITECRIPKNGIQGPSQPIDR